MNPKLLLSVLFSGTIILMLIMRWHGKELTIFPATKAGIVCLEFAKTKVRATEIVTLWSSISSGDLRKHAITNTYIDFVFIFFYSLFLYAGCYYYSLTQKKNLALISRIIAFMGLTAGLLDVIENYFLFRMLNFEITNAQAMLTWWLAAVKFLFAGIAVAFILIQFLSSFLFKPKNKTP